MEPLIQADVSRVKKEEWLSAYLKGRENAFGESNVLGGWRGAGLNPLDPAKILAKLPLRRLPSTPPTPSTRPIGSNSFDISLITSSPPDATMLQLNNKVLNDMMDKNAPLQTPECRYIKCLTKTMERLRAQNSILAQQNKELHDIIRARRQRKKGKQVVLAGQIVLTTKELTKAVIDIQNQVKKEKKKKRRRTQESPTPDSTIKLKAEEDIHEEPPTKKRWILDAVVV